MSNHIRWAIVHERIRTNVTDGSCRMRSIYSDPFRMYDGFTKPVYGCRNPKDILSKAIAEYRMEHKNPDCYRKSGF